MGWKAIVLVWIECSLTLFGDVIRSPTQHFHPPFLLGHSNTGVRKKRKARDRSDDLPLFGKRGWWAG
jgi:hypothetical protein